MKYLSKNELNNKISIMNDKMKIFENIIKNTNKEIKTLTNMFNEGKISLQQYNEKMDEYIKRNKDATYSIEELKNTYFDTGDVVRDAQISLEKDIIDALKERDEREKKALKEELDELEELIKTKKDKYEEDYKNYKESIDNKYDAEIEHLQRQKELLNRNFDTEKYNEKQAERNEELLKLQKKYQQISSDNSGMYEKEKLELQKKISELNKEISDAERDYLIKIQENTIDDTIRAKQQEKDRLIKMAEDKKNKEISSLEQIKNANSRTVNQIKQDLENLERSYSYYAKEAKKIMEKSQEEIVKFLKNNSSQWREAGNLQGQAWLDAILEKIALAQAALNSLVMPSFNISTGSNSVISTPSQGSISGNLGGSSKTGAQGSSYTITPTPISKEDALNNLSNAYAEARAKGDYVAMEQVNREANKIRTGEDKVTADKDIEYIKNKYGTTRDSGGIFPHGMLAVNLSGKDEQVLSPEQTKSWTKLVDNLPKLDNLVNFKIPNFNKLQLATAGTNSQTINLEVNLNNPTIAKEFDITDIGNKLGESITNKLKWSGNSNTLVRRR